METLTHIPPRDATGIHQGPHYITAKPQAVATVRGREQLLKKLIVFLIFKKEVVSLPGEVSLTVRLAPSFQINPYPNLGFPTGLKMETGSLQRAFRAGSGR
jgi:hypothetical protein